MVRFVEVDLNEDEDMEDAQQEASGSDEDEEEEEEEGDASDFIDILDVLDGRALPEDVDEVPKTDISRRKEDISVEEDEEEEEDVAEEEGLEDSEDPEADPDEAESDAEVEGSEAASEESDQAISASEDERETEGPDALANLHTFLSGLDPDAGQKRKASEDETTTQDEKKVKKRKFLKERTEVGAENAFAAHVGASHMTATAMSTPRTHALFLRWGQTRARRSVGTSDRSVVQLTLTQKVRQGTRIV